MPQYYNICSPVSDAPMWVQRGAVKLAFHQFGRFQICSFLSILLFLSFPISTVSGWGIPIPRIFRRFQQAPSSSPTLQHDLEYDLVIIGAGASGMFASGAATMLGSKTLLLDLANNTTKNVVGGDCTNSACVPSKAVRSIARMASQSSDASMSSQVMAMARKHATATVNQVRSREDPSAMVHRNPNLDIMFVSDCHFTSPHHLTFAPVEAFSSTSTTADISNNQTAGEPTITVYSKTFLIATGASPVVPQPLEMAAKQAGLPLYTYRTLFRPSDDDIDTQKESIWSLLDSTTIEDNKVTRHVVIAGGGATACEVGQALKRLGGERLQVSLVAPSLLSGEDVTLQNAAAQLLSADGVTLYLNCRLETVLPDRQILLSDNQRLPPVDALVVCVGRKPSSLESLHLQAARVDWDPTLGVIVNPRTLQSTSASNVYACGDCSSAVASKPTSRTAAHGAWTGYHAASNARLPWLLRLGFQSSTHPTVPRVIYTDPELVMVGLSRKECIEKYGTDGFDRLNVSEKGTDRADMEGMERNTIGFVEIRATKVDGKILGFTGCGPAAAELANEMSMAIVNGLTVRDVARSLHSYPSHGYLIYRVALAMALSNVCGLLEACGPVGGILANVGRLGSKVLRAPLSVTRRGGKHTHLRDWEARGEQSTIVVHHQMPKCSDDRAASVIVPKEEFQIISYLDHYRNSTFHERPTTSTEGSQNTGSRSICISKNGEDFRAWLSNRP
jgi:pyruvate/2-oxoglutarate dehydrogenase complex dihydrolipoamide dehydrogenase (E3) component